MKHLKTLSGASVSLLFAVLLCVSCCWVGFGTAQPVDMFMVTYDANGGVEGGVPVDVFSPYEAGSVVSVVGNPGDLAREGYVFLGWAFSSSASLPNFAVSESSVYPVSFVIGSSGDVTLFAVWGADPSSDSFVGDVSSIGVSSVSEVAIFLVFACLVILVWFLALSRGTMGMCLLSAVCWFGFAAVLFIVGDVSSGFVQGFSWLSTLLGVIMVVLTFYHGFGLYTAAAKNREENVL